MEASVASAGFVSRGNENSLGYPNKPPAEPACNCQRSVSQNREHTRILHLRRQIWVIIKNMQIRGKHRIRIMLQPPTYPAQRSSVGGKLDSEVCEVAEEEWRWEVFIVKMEFPP